jgi:hypothetical protein
LWNHINQANYIKQVNGGGYPLEEEEINKGIEDKGMLPK